MSYSLRNSIALGAMLLIVLGLGSYWAGVRQVAQIEALEGVEDDLEEDVMKIKAVLSIYDSTLADLNALRSRWASRTQVVPTNDTPAQTLSYLNELAVRSGSAMDFSFAYKGKRDEPSFSVNTYGLEGEARFETLYAFLWYLEHGRRFYTVDHLEVAYREPEARNSRWEWVRFKLALRAFFEPRSGIESSPTSTHVVCPNAKLHNPFRPLITRTLPENRLGLLDVERAHLQGLTQDLAFISDKNGEPVMLRQGDRVFMGRLSSIDIDRNRVEFVLNKGGLWERLALTVEMENSTIGRQP